jgi:hypothetical protein
MQVSSCSSGCHYSFLADGKMHVCACGRLTDIQQLWHNENTAVAAVTGRKHDLQCVRIVPQDTEHDAPHEFQTPCIKSSTRDREATCRSFARRSCTSHCADSIF